MKLLILADDVSAIFPQSDTSLAIARAALARDHEVWWARGDDVVLCNNVTVVRAQRILSSDPDVLPEVDTAVVCPVSDFAAISVRKNPPFDDSYTRLCWLLLPYESQVVISNRASLLLHHHEKMVPFQAVASGHLRPDDLVPTCVTNDAEIACAFTEEVANPSDQWIAKPWLGYAGHDVRKLCGVDAVRAYVISSQYPLMVQPFVPEVVDGDRRVLFVRGEVCGDIMRIPKPGDYISNLAHGGIGELQPMSDATRALCERLGAYLDSAGFDLAGADIIGPYVTEVNVTSPTGVVGITKLGGPDVAPRIVANLEERVQALTV